MVIHSIGDDRIVLFIDEEDLKARGIKGGLDAPRAKEIAEFAFISRGVLPETLKVEAYAGKKGAVVFATAIKTSAPLIFSFDTIKDAAQAARALDGIKLCSALYEQNSRYYLAVRGCEDGLMRTDWILRDFGKREGFSDREKVSENKNTVIDKDAVRILTRYWE